jgi:hypothetical protein
MLPGVIRGDIPCDLLLEPGLAGQMAVNFNVKKVLPGLRRLMPSLSHRKLATGIRLNIACPVVRQLHSNFPLEGSFRIHAGKQNVGMGSGEESCRNQHIANCQGTLDKKEISCFVPLF